MLANRNNLLGETIPAASCATGRNPSRRIGDIGGGNFNMNATMKTNNFPKVRFDDSRKTDKYPWLHGDYKAVAYFYVFKMFDTITRYIGGFNQ